MKTKFTREEIINRINYFKKKDFKIIKKNDIVSTTDMDYALDLYESDEAYAFIVNEECPSIIGNEIIISYKEVLFPVDIYHLTLARLYFYDLGLLALENGESAESFMFLHADMNAFASFFSSFYRFCPELIDEKRLEIQRKIYKMYEARLLHKYHRISELCDEVVDDIDAIINDVNISSLFSNEGILTLQKK